MLWVIFLSLPGKIPLWGLTCVLLMPLRSVSSSEGAWVCPGDSLDSADAAYRSRLRFPPDRQDQCGGRSCWERLRLKIVQGVTGDIWRLVEVAPWKLEQRILMFYHPSAGQQIQKIHILAQWCHQPHRSFIFGFHLKGIFWVIQVKEENVEISLAKFH